MLAQSVKNLPAVQEAEVQSLGQEDPLGKEMATHSSILAWKIPWTEEPGGLQSMGLQESDLTQQLNYHKTEAPSNKHKFRKIPTAAYRCQSLLKEIIFIKSLGKKTGYFNVIQSNKYIKHLLWAGNGPQSLEAYSLMQYPANLSDGKVYQVTLLKVEIVKLSPGISIQFVRKVLENYISLKHLKRLLPGMCGNPSHVDF